MGSSDGLFRDVLRNIHQIESVSCDYDRRSDHGHDDGCTAQTHSPEIGVCLYREYRCHYYGRFDGA